LGGSQIGVRKKGLHLLKNQGCLQQSLGVTQKWLTLLAKEALLVELCDFSGNNHSLKPFYICNSENV